MESRSLSISCVALIMMLLGLVQQEWVKLKKISTGNLMSSSPWISCINLNCTELSPTDLKKPVWNLMATATLLSTILSFALGLDYTDLLPPIKGRKSIFSFISFLTAGTCLLAAITLYYQDLKNGIKEQYSDFKVTWVFHSTYIIIFLYYACGILCVWDPLPKFFQYLLQKLSKQSVIDKKETIKDETTEKKSFLSIVQSQNLSKISTSTIPTQTSQVTWNL
ncbi:transmembrane protein 225 [Gracilinanus agilis]|uniref:transmembrane protein 225 n=1 Tax=Gracilinanus agilis TaxID=191870 RepID=UPI001CFD130C|nr:transmembrane protein 225 [Gracilinanus agilis]